MRRALLPVALLLAACGRDGATPAPRQPAAAPARPKVAIFGVDGATFDVIDPLLARGELPTLRGLIDRGARCVLKSEIAEGSSPVLWAHLATGTRKAQHGLAGFTQTVGDQQVLLTSDDRLVPAIWNMVDTRGGSVGLVGWWNTWPAEHVRGYIVSDLFSSSLYKRNFSAVVTEGLTWPPDLVDELLPCVHAPSELRREELAPLGDFNQAEWAALSADDSAREWIEHDGLAALRYGLQSQKSYVDAALYLLETRPQPDLFFVFLELPDRVSHNFWQTWEPNSVKAGARAVDEGWRRRWKGIVPGAYELVDDAICRVLDHLGPETTILVVSDHGFRSTGSSGGSPADLAHVGGSGTHDEHGVLIAAGPGIARGATCEAATYDLPPTVLALLGLPGTTQGIGRVLAPLLAPDFLTRHPLQPAIAEPPRATADAPLLGPGDEWLKYMRAIGYTPGEKNEQPSGDGGADKPTDH
jgi:predicted AlkP superfamily phosphohydrolase/phosphomutase